MSRRVMGSASFAEIQDSKGKIQIYVRRDDICEEMIKHYTTQSLRKSLIWEILLELQGMFSRLRWVKPPYT